MDVTRVADDLGKLYFQNHVTHASICGVRGSFLLASGRLECNVGWDTACLTEDYDFAWKVGSPVLENPAAG